MRGIVRDIGQVVLFLVLPPIAVLGVLFLASQATGIQFGTLVFALMMILVARWAFMPTATMRTPSAGTGGAGQRGPHGIDSGPARSEASSTGAVSGVVLVPEKVPLPGYFTLILAEAVILGAVILLVSPW